MRKILQYGLDGIFIKEFLSISEVKKDLGLSSHGNISKCCSTGSGSSNGYQWRYHEEGFPTEITPVQKRGERFKELYGRGTEGNRSVTEKRKRTSLEKWGSEHPMGSETVKETLRRTSLERYGVVNPSQHETVKKKISETERTKKTRSLFSKYPELEPIEEIDGGFSLRSKICGHDFEINRQLLTVRKKNQHVICTVCNPVDLTQTSQVEKILLKDISEKFDGVKIEENVRGLVDGKTEVDIYFPDFNFGVEVNGVNFHSEKYGKGKDYHLNKTIKYREKGIRIFHFFDDEIYGKTDLILSMVGNTLGKSRRIYGRNCEVKRINDTGTVRDFIEMNHIQGWTNSSVNYGLYHQEELVSVMTFGPLRSILGSKSKEGEWEIIRMCSLCGVTVVGGPSKMFKRFIQDQNPTFILSYSNRRWSEGNVYHQMGMTLDGETEPGYWYFYKNKRVHRWTLRKSELVKMGYDPKMTEEEIVFEMGIPKIWDCGNFRFVWRNNS